MRNLPHLVLLSVALFTATKEGITLASKHARRYYTHTECVLWSSEIFFAGLSFAIVAEYLWPAGLTGLTKLFTLCGLLYLWSTFSDVPWEGWGLLACISIVWAVVFRPKLKEE